MLIAAHHRMAGKRLPYDAEVEYLESTGTQYINTGWIPVRNAKLSIDFALMASVNNLPMQSGCINNGGKPYYIWFWTGTNQSNYLLVNYFGDFSETSWGGANRYTRTPAGSIRWGVRNVATYDGATGVSTLNDDVFQGGACNSTPSVPLFLYARNNRGVAELFSKLKVYGFSVDVEGVKILDYIPVRVGTVGYLYDRVSGKLFGNAGTGDFVVGPDVVPITWADNERYLNDGVVEAFTGLSRIDDYIPVVGGHSITWKWGDRIIGQAYLIVYNANKQVIDFWSPNNASGERTLDINATAAYARYSVDPAFKETTFFKDNTTGEYAVMNGMVVV